LWGIVLQARENKKPPVNFTLTEKWYCGTYLLPRAAGQWGVELDTAAKKTVFENAKYYIKKQSALEAADAIRTDRRTEDDAGNGPGFRPEGNPPHPQGG
jgi:hypothetical protein